jgi:hypothetical protein
MNNDFAIKWLMEGDPSIRWQTMRDLLDEEPAVIRRERARTVKEGWAARLLSFREPAGLFGGGLYGPKWISTTYTLLLLRRLGIPPDTGNIKISCWLLLDKGFFSDGGINYFQTMSCSETCVTGMILSILGYFRYPDDRTENLVSYLLREQMPDGGWNCQKYRGATHGSFHTTISVLEGLHYYKSGRDQQKPAIDASIKRAVQFLLCHRLYKSHRSGKTIDPRMTRLSFPPRWRYDIIRGLDYFQKIQTAYDSRMDDALEILVRKRRSDGTWPLQQRHPGRTFFEMEHTGQPSRWNTLRALRILKWFDIK